MEWYEFYWEWISKTFSSFWWLEVIGFTVGMLATLKKMAFPDLWFTISKKVYQFILAFVVIVLLLGLISAPFSIYHDKDEEVKALNTEIERLESDISNTNNNQVPSVQDLKSKYHEGININISDLVLMRDSLLIDGDTFKNCDIYGPILINLDGKGLMLDCEFDEPLDNLFVVTTNDRLYGVVQFANCEFIQCRFHKIAFICKEEQVGYLKRSITESKQ